MSDVPAEQPFTHQEAQELLESHRRLSASIEELHPEIGALTKRLDNIKKKAEAADKVATSNRRVVRMLAVATVLVLCLTIGAILAIRSATQQTERAEDSIARAEAAINDIQQTRTESRRVTCEQHNRLLEAIEIKIISAGSAAILTLVPGADSPDDLTPELREAYERYRQALTDDNSLSDRRRDCSPEGIAAYYEQPAGG